MRVMTAITPLTIDSSTLLGYFNAQMTTGVLSAINSAQQTLNTASATSSSSSSSNSTAGDTPPWSVAQPSQQVEDAKVMSTTNFLDTSNVPLSAGTTTDSKTEQDNQNLFSLYTAVNTLSYLASMAQRSGMTSGQLQGLNTRFQTGLQQVESFISNTDFNNFTLQAQNTSPSVTSTVSIPFASFDYTGSSIVSDDDLSNALPNVSSGESFDVAVTKGGTTTDVPIDLSQVQGGLTLDNIVTYVNQQLQAGGFTTRFSRVMTSGTINDPTDATYGVSISPGVGESVDLESSGAQPALYVAGNTGSPTGTTTVNAATGTTSTSTPDQQGRLVKLTDLSSGDPSGVFSATTTPDSGTTTAQSTVVDSQGNVYVLGNSTGDFGTELNQGSQDVYLSKYDSAGNLSWTKLVGSAGTASAASMALDPNGGVVISGTTNADLSTSAIADGNNDSFVASYDADGNQNWETQLPTLSANNATSISVDASGNVYLGGNVTGVLGAGQTSSGQSDAYVTKLDPDGKIVYEQQFGTSGSDTVAATATTSDGGLVVASTQNGEAYLTKYANGDATGTPEWTVDVGALNNGQLSSLAVSGDQIYLAGSSSNPALTANGQATVASAASGNTDAFVFNLTDNGTSATPNTVSYVGTSGIDKAGALTVGSDGTVYLTGSTTGTFAGQVRTAQNTTNTFVSALNSDGSVEWTTQYGGADGHSSGQAVAIDPNGASVLDALGLPRGTINVNQSVDLASQTTLRTGDSFNIDLQGTGARNIAITIAQGETMQSLATKISGELQNAGSAKVTYTGGGEALQITMNAGYSANLVAGPTDTDALARLGIPAGVISAPAKTGATTSSASSSSSSSSSTSSTSQTFGLGIKTSMDISTSGGAAVARADLLPVLASIQSIYLKMNTPASATSGTASSSSSSGTVPAYLTSQIANYSLALTQLASTTSTTA
jgi:hypothetical protein